MRSKKAVAAMLAAAMVAAGILVVLHPTQASASGPGAQYFTNTPLVTQDGKTVHFFDDLIRGKSVVINFIYTQCGDSCPLETARLAQVKKDLPPDIKVDVALDNTRFIGQSIKEVEETLLISFILKRF